jgi:hypothetical protein
MPGGHRHRIIRPEPHQQRAERRGQAGGDEDRAVIHPGLGEDRRVHEHDVGHGEEGGEARAKFGADARSSLAQAEIAIERIGGRLRFRLDLFAFGRGHGLNPRLPVSTWVRHRITD